jgi:phage terminase small subunit
MARKSVHDLAHVPHLATLSPMQAAFVVAFVETGAANGTQAALAAGASSNSASQQAHAWLRHPAVADAIRTETSLRLSSLAPVALAVQLHLASNGRSEFVRQQAASDILDRAGYRPPDRHQVAVGGSIVLDIKL